MYKMYAHVGGQNFLLALLAHRNKRNYCNLHCYPNCSNLNFQMAKQFQMMPICSNSRIWDFILTYGTVLAMIDVPNGRLMFPKLCTSYLHNLQLSLTKEMSNTGIGVILLCLL